MFTRALTIFSALSACISTSWGVVPLQNATATYSQPFNGPWLALEMIDGSFADNNGWAVFVSGGGPDPTQAHTAVFETVSDLTSTGLRINMHQNYSSFPGHTVGRFRWSYTTDPRSEFADGLQTGGDVTANWTPMTPTEVLPGAAFSASILGDGSVRIARTGGVPATALYTVTFGTVLTGATGLRLEVLEDSSLPFNGPGMYSPNGNFVLTEVVAQTIPAFSSGTVTLQNYVGSPAAHPIQMNLSQGTTTIHSSTVTLDSTGNYSFVVPATVASGNYQFSADGSPFLKRTFTVAFPGGGVPVTVNFSLPNGDCDNSGEVDAADIDLVITAFGQISGDPGYSLSTDVDGSGEVDAADIDIVIANFGLVDN